LSTENNRKIYNNNCRRAHKDLKLREKRKINASNQTDNQIQKKNNAEENLMFSCFTIPTYY
jgi:hypothetical protein